MQVIRAKTAGFCMGVDLALRKLDQAIARAAQEGGQGEAGAKAGKGGRLLMLGPIIHNPQVLAAYAAKGVLRAEHLDEIRPGDTVVIRAHGIPRSAEARLNALGARVIDATCPKVKRAQLAIAEATAGGQMLCLFGESDHPEVRGLVSYAGGPCQVFAKGEALQLGEEGKPVVLAAQTTQERKEFDAICARLRESGRPLTVLSTICDATRKRQEEAAAIASQVELMIVIGGRESGNTRRLADVVRACGVCALHVETPDEAIHEVSLRKCAIAGITAGASTPKQLIDAVHRLLEEKTDL